MAVFKTPQLPDDLDPGTLTDGMAPLYDVATERWVPGVPDSGTSGTVTSVNGIEPDENGNVEIDAGGVDIKVGGSQPASGWWLDDGSLEPDSTPPSTPTGLTATATGGSTVNLSWTASTDNIGVTGYHYRIGTGAAVDAGAGTTETVTGLAPLTAYSFQVRAYDAQANVSGWSTAANATTLDGPDTTAPTPGTLAASAITSTTFTLTVTGASDAVGLHATPYAFSTDNGTTWSAWQAGATYNVTGRSPSTTYQARHKVRDAAGNEATGTAITVETAAPTPAVVDTFNRADTTQGLGTTSDGTKTWAGTGWKISNNSAAYFEAGGLAWLDDAAPTQDMRVAIDVILNGPNQAFGSTLRVRVSGDRASFYAVAFSPTATTMLVELFRVAGGTTNVANWTQSTAITGGVPIPVVVEAKQEGGSTRVKVTIDGTERINYLDTAATRPTGTGVGLAAKGGASFDNLAVYPA